MNVLITPVLLMRSILFLLVSLLRSRLTVSLDRALVELIVESVSISFLAEKEGLRCERGCSVDLWGTNG